MTKDDRTLEMAKLYEQQGYFQEALDIYLNLGGRGSKSAYQAEIQRLERELDKAGSQAGEQQNVSSLFEKWMMLMVLRYRLNHYIRISRRLA